LFFALKIELSREVNGLAVDRGFFKLNLTFFFLQYG
jgi:hypothetical protein